MSRQSGAWSRRLAAAAIGILLGAFEVGCTHYHYYGQQSPMLYSAPGGVGNACDPVLIEQGAAPLSATTPEFSDRSAPALVAEAPQGAICDVPGSISTVGVGNGQRQVVVGSGAPRYVTSSPTYNSTRPRFAWRRPDPESLATTRISGQASDPSTIR